MNIAVAVNAEMSNPILAGETPKGPVSESRIGERTLESIGAMTFASRSNWKFRSRRISTSSANSEPSGSI